MIICKTPREIEIMREAGRIVALTHQELKQHITPGITTKELDQIAEKTIQKYGATPSFKGYNGFPGSICASVNEELVHGIPGKRKLKEGDIISIDIGAKYNGYHGDSAWTYPVGNISESVQKLLDVTEKSLYLGLENQARDYQISHMRFKPMLKRMDSRSLGSMLVTESGKTYMRTLKSRTMVHQIEALD